MRLRDDVWPDLGAAANRRPAGQASVSLATGRSSDNLPSISAADSADCAGRLSLHLGVKHRQRFWTFVTLSMLAACVVTSCSRSRSPADLKASVSAIRQHADSFAGLSMSEARSRLAEGKLSEEDWNEGGFKGKQLVAMFPQHEVRVMFLDGKAIATSIQIISE